MMHAPFRPQSTAILTADELQRLDDEALNDLLDATASQGIGDIIVEIDDVPDALVHATRERGLRLLIGVTCFHEHGHVQLHTGFAQRPVGADGAYRERLEWYVGLLPTDARVTTELVARCARLAAVPGVAGLVLDFIRWPLHWEIELREDGVRLPPASFDHATLADFRHRTGIDVPQDAVAAASEIARNHPDRWQQYRSEVITEIVQVISGVTQRAGAALGAFVVPIAPDLVGQDIAGWRGSIDVIYPMSYHAILRRSPQWVGEVVDDMRRRGGGDLPVVPVVQLTASDEFAGEWDWGDDFGRPELDAAIAAGSRRGPVAYFPGTAIQAALGHRSVLVARKP